MRWRRGGVWLALLLASTMTVLAADATPKKAACVVCKVRHGEAEEEDVKAVRSHEGIEYGFCSEKCVREFDADPAAYVPPSFPRSAPAFSLTDLSGRALSRESLEGKVVLLDFWATWCVPCRKSMPELQALHAKYSGRGFTVLGVSIDEGDAARVKKFVASKKITYPIAIDGGENPAWRAYRVKAVPAAYLIDRQGQLRAQWTGAPASARELEDEIGKWLASD